MKKVILCAVMALVGCGGGGGGDNGSDFGGTYVVRLLPTETNCSNPSNVADLVFSVNESGSSIIASDSHYSYTGSQIGENAFLLNNQHTANCVDRNGNETAASISAVTTTVEFNAISDQSAEIEYQSVYGDCSNNGGSHNSCHRYWKGTATRQ